MQRHPVASQADPQDRGPPALKGILVSVLLVHNQGEPLEISMLGDKIRGRHLEDARKLGELGGCLLRLWRWVDIEGLERHHLVSPRELRLAISLALVVVNNQIQTEHTHRGEPQCFRCNGKGLGHGPDAIIIFGGNSGSCDCQLAAAAVSLLKNARPDLQLLQS